MAYVWVHDVDDLIDFLCNSVRLNDAHFQT